MPNVLCTEQATPIQVDSITATAPAGTSAGDLLVAVVAKDDPAATTVLISESGADPWIQQAQNALGGSTSFAVFTLVVPVGFGGSATFESSGDVGIWAVNMAAYSGVDPFAPVNAANAGINTNGPSAPSVVALAPSITTTIDGCVLIYASSTINHEGLFADLQTPPVGMALEQSGQSTFGGPDAQVALFDELRPVAGPTGDRTQTIGVQAPANFVTSFCFMFAIQPVCLD